MSNMIDYTKFTVQDFAKDEGFISWCLDPTADKDAFWNNLPIIHTNIKETITEAKALVTDLQHLENENLTDDFEKEIWNKIEPKLAEDPMVKPNLDSDRPRKSSLVQITGIALLLCILGYIGFQLFSNFEEVNEKLEWNTYVNNTGLQKEIILDDSSTVVLEPFSFLKYPDTFSGDQRMVLLQGEAFFDIKRDTLKPFLVYANETITKVLGTSFHIAAYVGEKNVEVEVVTGKVAVYANVDSKNSKKNSDQPIAIKTDKVEYIPRPNKKLEILPNQKVVFDSRASKMIRKIAKLPKLIKKIEQISQLNFENEPVIKLFLAIEEAYGIDLDYDLERLEECRITTRLKEEPLFEKLDIVCTALDLSYEQKDGRIIIDGSGCN